MRMYLTNLKMFAPIAHKPIATLLHESATDFTSSVVSRHDDQIGTTVKNNSEIDVVNRRRRKCVVIMVMGINNCTLSVRLTH